MEKIENFIIAGLTNDSIQANELATICDTFTNNSKKYSYKFDFHTNIKKNKKNEQIEQIEQNEQHNKNTIDTEISNIMNLYNSIDSHDNYNNLGELKYTKDYGVNIIKNINIYENGIIIVMINGKSLFINRKWDNIIPNVNIDYYNYITLDWIETIDSTTLYKRDISQMSRIYISLYGKIKDIYWCNDNNISYRDNYLPSHISFSKDTNHSFYKWSLYYNTCNHKQFTIYCCGY